MSKFTFKIDQKLGQSKTLIELLTLEDGNLGVKKSIEGDDSRFKLQYEKHLQAASFDFPDSQVPKILKIYGGGAYIMEYMHGSPLGIFLESASQHEVLNISNILIRLLTNMIENRDSKIDSSLMQYKIHSFHKNKVNNEIEIFSDLQKKLLVRTEKLIIPAGWNHGDFSYENILIAPSTKEIVLLDFLDSPFESPYIDLGRIWLDAEYGWWGSGLIPSSNSVLNSRIISNSLIELCANQKIDIAVLDIFAGFAALRVFPYTTNPVRLSFLKRASREILERL